MTGMDERLAKVAEVLCPGLWDESVVRAWPEDVLESARNQARAAAQALEPLLAEWQAEDEARVANVAPSAFNGYEGTCPKCGEVKFIGHGPLCIDCFTGRAALDGAQS